MIFETTSELKNRIRELTGHRTNGEVKIHEDTSSYMDIAGGSVLRLSEDDYYVTNDAREGRFGIDDQPKFWVKYAVDLTSGERKVIKLVFHESFTVPMGFIRIRCTRSPQKETDVLALVRDKPRFMQGVTVVDPAGNLVRIIDHIPGPSLYRFVESIDMPHEAYFYETMPGIMKQVIACIRALDQLHRGGQHHGDVRNDHILIDNRSGVYTWIDFDYEVNYSDYDIWSMGNIINLVVGKGHHTNHDLRLFPNDYPHFKGALDESDRVLLFKNRVANLRKLYPYIPAELNDILMRFSTDATDFYTDLRNQADDLIKLFPEAG